MPDGRRQIRHLVPALAAALVILAGAFRADSAAADACPIPGTSDGVRRGVNRTNLAWEPEWRSVLERMAEAGVGAVRLTLTQPLELAAEVAAEAHRQGMQVLINLPLSLGEYYGPAAMPRPGNGTVRAVHRLSELEPGRYADTVGLFLAELDRRGGVSLVARRHDINANLVFKWKRQAEAGAPDPSALPTGCPGGCTGTSYALPGQPPWAVKIGRRSGVNVASRLTVWFSAPPAATRSAA